MAEELENTEAEVKTEASTEKSEQSQELSSEDTEKEQGEDEDGTDEGTDEPSGAGSAEEEPVKPVSRSQARIQALNERLKSQDAEKERLIHERAQAQAQLELMREQQRNLQNDAQRRAHEERMALLDPSEKALYQANEQMRSLEWRLNQMELQRKDDQDRANFHAKAAHDETYAKYSDQVEAMYQEGLKRGVSASREDLHSFILGKELKKDLSAKVSKKKESASKRIDSVTAKPASARGDVADSKKGKSVEDRLRGVQI